jgi:hypothetical protein
MTVAEQMREKALSKGVSNRYNDIIKDIDTASDNEELSLIVPNLPGALIRLLNDDGFIVEILTTPNRIQRWHTIKW